MIITEQSKLDRLCADLAQEPFITVDTEFLREKTYYAQLCLVQVAGPEGDAAAIDPLEGGLDLTPLYDLLANENVLKIFHAARQDLEIFYNLTEKIPHPLFDTQVAAMVCGYGEQIGYTNLVKAITDVQLDKAQQFTDWSRRPLSKKQVAYALDDVTYLRDVYHALAAELEDKGRTKWVAQEMDILTSPDTYKNPPEDAWQRIKVRTHKPRVLAVLREAAAWREHEAQHRDVPRNRVVRDETLADLAAHPPETMEALGRIRGFSPDMARGRLGKGVLEAVKIALALPKDQCPQPEKKDKLPLEHAPALEMLKMLLRIQAAENGVAAKLIANSDDLQELARHGMKADVPALKGWRYEVFGKEAEAMLKGRLSLTLKNGAIHKMTV